MITWATCAGCGEQIGQIPMSFHPLEYRWLHCDWQVKYDQLPKPKAEVS